MKIEKLTFIIASFMIFACQGIESPTSGSSQSLLPTNQTTSTFSSSPGFDTSPLSPVSGERSGGPAGYVCDVPALTGNSNTCFADLDQNGVVNGSDRGQISANFGSTEPDILCLLDLDGNGIINASDRGFVSASFGSCHPLPNYQNGSGLNADGSGPDQRFDLPPDDSNCDNYFVGRVYGDMLFHQLIADPVNNVFYGTGESYYDDSLFAGDTCNSNKPTISYPKHSYENDPFGTGDLNSASISLGQGGGVSLLAVAGLKARDSWYLPGTENYSSAFRRTSVVVFHNIETPNRPRAISFVPFPESYWIENIYTEGLSVSGAFIGDGKYLAVVNYPDNLAPKAFLIDVSNPLQPTLSEGVEFPLAFYQDESFETRADLTAGNCQKSSPNSQELVCVGAKTIKRARLNSQGAIETWTSNVFPEFFYHESRYSFVMANKIQVHQNHLYLTQNGGSAPGIHALALPAFGQDMTYQTHYPFFEFPVGPANYRPFANLIQVERNDSTYLHGYIQSGISPYSIHRIFRISENGALTLEASPLLPGEGMVELDDRLYIFQGNYITYYDYADIFSPTHIGNLLERGRPGDMNCDNLVNVDDEPLYQTALQDPSAYNLSQPNCPIGNADMNDDGQINDTDWQLFQAAIN